MTRYFMSCDSIVTSRRRVEIQSTSKITQNFTTTKCNKLFITYHTRSTERLPSLPSSVSTIAIIAMTIVGERAKRARHSQVCSIMNGASELIA